MGYQTASNSQKKPSSTISSKSSSSSSSRHSIPTTTASSSSRYLTAVANSNVPYESPYAQNRDKKPASRSTSEQTILRASTSAYSSSSPGGSLYTSSPAPSQYRQTTPGTMSTSRTMSSVSQCLHLSEIFFLSSFVYSYTSIYGCAVYFKCLMLYQCRERAVTFTGVFRLGSLEPPCLASGLALRRTRMYTA